MYLLLNLLIISLHYHIMDNNQHNQKLNGDQTIIMLY